MVVAVSAGWHDEREAVGVPTVLGCSRHQGGSLLCVPVSGLCCVVPVSGFAFCG
jgi:hypothetical protein